MLDFSNIKEIVIPKNGVQKQVLAIFDKYDMLMWKRKYTEDYFRITNTDRYESLDVTLQVNYSTQQYSVDEGATWISFPAIPSGRYYTSQTVTLTPYSTVIYKTSSDVDYNKSSFFSMSGNGKAVASGKIMSLRKVNYKEADEPMLFDSLFKNCIQLVKVDFIMPKTMYVLKNRIPYQSDFSQMFAGCTGLVWVPTNMLPGTVLTPDCYSRMFEGCTSLKQAPHLLGSPRYDSSSGTHASGFYYRMFSGCSTLNYLKCTLPVSGFESVTNVNMMLENVHPTGTLDKNPNVSASYWSGSVTGIPVGWTILDIA